MMNVIFKADKRWFRRKMQEAIDVVADFAYEAMWKAMREHLNDCLNVPPTVPFDTGWLKENHEITVDGFGKYVRGEVTVDEDKVKYAVIIHEGISRWGTPFVYKTPGSGAKWIESKLIRFKGKYKNIMHEHIMQDLHRAGF